MVSHNPEKAHKPPRSPQDLYILRFWVLLPRVSLVWDVTLKRASPTQARLWLRLAGRKKDNLAFTGGSF